MESQEKEESFWDGDPFWWENTWWWDSVWFQCVQVGLWCISAILSAILFVGLLVPLLLQLKQKRHSRPTPTTRIERQSNRSRIERASNRSRIERASNRPTTHIERASNRSSVRGEANTNYSTFNMYLIYIAIGDLLMSLYAIQAIVRWKFLPLVLLADRTNFNLLPGNPSDWELALLGYINFIYIVAQVCINAVMGYQIKILLETSQRIQRLKQPSLARVNLQGAAAYLLPAIGFCGFFVPSASHITFIVSAFISYFPASYILYVTFLVWWRGYIPPMNGTSSNVRAARALAFYFYRILGTFFVVYIPGIILAHIPQCRALTGLLLSINPIATFCVIIKKSDVKRYIIELVTLSYVFSDCDCNCNFDCNWIGRKYEVEERNIPRRVSSTVIVLGFEITEEEGDSDSDSSDGDSFANTDSDVESMNIESGADGVGLAETTDGDHDHDHELSKDYSCASRLPGERPTSMTVLITGKSISADAVNETARTARTTGSGCSDVPTTTRDK